MMPIEFSGRVEAAAAWAVSAKSDGNGGNKSNRHDQRMHFIQVFLPGLASG
jgi:hypothetical protein